jgi:hypothetical protein
MVRIQPKTADNGLVPLAEASVRLRMNRERLLRRIQSGAIAGRQVDGLWFVERAALDEEIAAQSAQRLVSA